MNIPQKIMFSEQGKLQNTIYITHVKRLKIKIKYTTYGYGYVVQF